MSLHTHHSQDTAQELNDAQAAFPPHVQEFIKLSQDCEQMIKSKKPVQMTIADSRMKLLFASMPVERQEDIRTFLEQQKAGMQILTQQKWNRRLQGALSIPGVIAGSLAKTVPAIAMSTVEFALATIGALGVGLYRGGRSIYRQTQMAA